MWTALWLSCLFVCGTLTDIVQLPVLQCIFLMFHNCEDYLEGFPIVTSAMQCLGLSVNGLPTVDLAKQLSAMMPATCLRNILYVIDGASGGNSQPYITCFVASELSGNGLKFVV